MVTPLIRLLVFVSASAFALPLLAATGARAEPETVYFKSADGKTEIVGYLYKPEGPGPHPAIVLLPGRAGPYSTKYNKDCTDVGRGITSDCNAGTLSMRHKMWGEFWAGKGLLALLPDSFGPRGVGKGFPRFSHGQHERDSTNEKTVRPFDAEGALTYLRARDDVADKPVFLQGWSNGGSTTLNVMTRQAAKSGFRAALAFYPGCGKDALIDDKKIVTTAPVALFMGEADEEVSPAECKKVAKGSIDASTPFTDTFYPGATHDFDDPGDKRQDVQANRVAKQDATDKSAAMLAGFIQP
jgi:dienelactone hydrolase